MPERSRRARLLAVGLIVAMFVALTIVNYAVSTRLAADLLLVAAPALVVLAGSLYVHERRGSRG